MELAKLSTQYGRHMLFLSNKIFGEVVRSSNKSVKVVNLLSEKPNDMRDEIVNYYPRHVETHLLVKELRNYGFFRDEHQDFKEEMKRLKKLRGKGPPKKGEGRRSKK